MAVGIVSTEVYDDGFLCVLLFGYLVFKTLADDLFDHTAHGWEPILISHHLFFFFGHSQVSKVVCGLDNFSLQAFGGNDLIHSENWAIHCIQLLLHATTRYDIWVLSVLFPVSGEYLDRQFLILGIFASFFLDVLYNNSMFGCHKVLEYFIYSILSFFC